MEPLKVESGVQLFSRISKKTDLNGLHPILFAEGGPFQNQTIEIAGNSKNDLLLDLIIRCILPSNLDPSWKDSGVILIISEFHLSVFRITKTINEALKKLNIESVKRKCIIEEALKHVTILNCYGKEEMEASFFNLEKIVQDKDDVTLLVIDNIGANYWLAKQVRSMLSFNSYCSYNLSLVQNIIRNLNLVFVFSRSESASELKNLDYKITVENNEALVTNYDKKTNFRTIL